MLEYSESFGEDGQRLTDSWYRIKKTVGESVQNDDDDNDIDDDICVEGLLNMENNNNNLNYDSDVNDDDDDDICD